MESFDLTFAQLLEVRERAGEFHGYLQSLLDRMAEKGFPEDDQLREWTTDLEKNVTAYGELVLHLANAVETARISKSLDQAKTDERRRKRGGSRVDPPDPRGVFD